METGFCNDRSWLGVNIAYYRRARKLSQMELAERVDISRTHMAAIEVGMKTPSLHVTYNIADELGIPMAKLFEEH